MRKMCGAIAASAVVAAVRTSREAEKYTIMMHMETQVKDEENELVKLQRASITMRSQLLTQSCLNPSNSPHATTAKNGRVNPRVAQEVQHSRAIMLVLLIMRGFRRSCVG